MFDMFGSQLVSRVCVVCKLVLSALSKTINEPERLTYNRQVSTNLVTICQRVFQRVHKPSI